MFIIREVTKGSPDFMYVRHVTYASIAESRGQKLDEDCCHNLLCHHFGDSELIIDS
jgi:hypothetical protein